MNELLPQVKARSWRSMQQPTRRRETNEVVHDKMHLPFQFILSKLPRHFNKVDEYANTSNGTIEPILYLETIVKSMTPPYCWNSTNDNATILSTDGRPMMDDKGTPIVLPILTDRNTPNAVQPATWINGTDRNEMDEDRAASNCIIISVISCRHNTHHTYGFIRRCRYIYIVWDLRDVWIYLDTSFW